jgi:arylmalonate decarboxylase
MSVQLDHLEQMDRGDHVALERLVEQARRRGTASPYGWRGRIGLLIPSANTVVEPEFARLLPPGISVHGARLRNARNDLADGLGMLAHVERAADELGSARVDVLALACTTASFIRGQDGERELRQRIARAAAAASSASGGGHAPPAVVTTSGAVVAALRALGIDRTVLVTPYLPDVNALEEAFLREHGVAVAATAGQPVDDACAIADLRPETVYHLARAAVRHAAGQATGIFLSCTNLPTLPIIDALEQDTGLPVVTSNQATAWACLRALGCALPIPGYGRLLSEATAASIPTLDQ